MDIKMSDVFELPLMVTSGVEDHLYDIAFDEGDDFYYIAVESMDDKQKAEHVSHAINTHDQYVEEIRELRDMLEIVLGDYQVLASVAEHEGYKTDYSTISAKAKQLLEGKGNE